MMWLIMVHRHTIVGERHQECRIYIQGKAIDRAECDWRILDNQVAIKNLHDLTMTGRWR